MLFNFYHVSFFFLNYLIILFDFCNYRIHVELIIPIGIPSKEVKAEIETQLKKLK